MNWAANPATKGLGASFKGVSVYLLSPKEPEQAVEERVAFTACRNLPTDDASRAWRMMAETALRRDQLKLLAGGSAAGRKVKEGEFKPVFHYSLAWHPDERPDPAEMERAAVASLKALQLEHHEALLVAHNDQGHAHLHVVVNRVDPDTGKLNALSHGFKKLDRWAAEYERETGRIVSHNREEKHRAIDEGRQVPEGQRWLPHSEWMQARQAERAAARGGAQGERDSLWESQQGAQQELLAAAKLRAREMGQELRARQRPGWQQLGREQARCTRDLELSLKSRKGIYGFVNRHRELLKKAWPDPEDRQAEWHTLLTPGGLERAVIRAQAMETAEFKRDVTFERHQMERAYWADYRKQVSALREAQTAERAELRAQQKDKASERTTTTATKGERPETDVPWGRRPETAFVTPRKRRVTPPEGPTRPKHVVGGGDPGPGPQLRDDQAREKKDRTLRRMGLARQEASEIAGKEQAQAEARAAKVPETPTPGASARIGLGFAAALAAGAAAYALARSKKDDGTRTPEPERKPEPVRDEPQPPRAEGKAATASERAETATTKSPLAEADREAAARRARADELREAHRRAALRELGRGPERTRFRD